MTNKLFRIVVLITLLFCSIHSDAKQKSSFKVTSIQDRHKKSFAFIEVKYKCNVKKAKSAELKIYVLLKKGRKETVALETFNLSDVEKGTHRETFMITPKYTDKYGTPRKFRAEIWYKDRLIASKTKPGAKKKKWWEKKDIAGIILPSDREIEKLLKKED